MKYFMSIGRLFVTFFAGIGLSLISLLLLANRSDSLLCGDANETCWRVRFVYLAISVGVGFVLCGLHYFVGRRFPKDGVSRWGRFVWRMLRVLLLGCGIYLFLTFLMPTQFLAPFGSYLYAYGGLNCNALIVVLALLVSFYFVLFDWMVQLVCVNLSFWRRALSFRGTASFHEFCFYLLFYWIAMFFIRGVGGLMSSGLFAGLVNFVCYWVSWFLFVALVTRRLHDFGRSGWWSLPFVVWCLRIYILGYLFHVFSGESWNSSEIQCVSDVINRVSVIGWCLFLLAMGPWGASDAVVRKRIVKLFKHREKASV